MAGLPLEEALALSALLGDESCEAERRGGPGAGLEGDTLWGEDKGGKS